MYLQKGTEDWPNQHKKGVVEDLFEALRSSHVGPIPLASQKDHSDKTRKIDEQQGGDAVRDIPVVKAFLCVLRLCQCVDLQCKVTYHVTDTWK